MPTCYKSLLPCPAPGNYCSAFWLHRFVFSEYFIQYVIFCNWLLLLSVMFFEVHPCCSILSIVHSLLLLVVFHWMDSPVDGHLDYSQLLATMNNTAMNIHVRVSVSTYVFISVGYIPRSEMAVSYGTCTFNFLKKLPNHLPKWRHHFLFPPASNEDCKLNIQEIGKTFYLFHLCTSECVCQIYFSSLTRVWKKIVCNTVDSLQFISHPSVWWWIWWGFWAALTWVNT